MKLFVVELTLTVDADGGTETFYYSTRGFRTKPTDTPANTWVEPRVRNLGKLRRDLFKGARVTGAIKPAIAALVLDNNDGELDAWLDYGVSGSRVRYLWGDEGAAFPAGYEVVQIAYLKDFSLPDFSQVMAGLRDRSYLLDRALVTATFLGSGGIEGTGVASKKKQWVSGDPGYFPPIVVNVVDQIYYVQETSPGIFGSYFQVFEGGVEITREADYGSEAALLGAAPSSGKAKFWFGPTGTGPVYVRLGTPPTLELRIYSIGTQEDGSDWSFDALCRRAGMSDVVDLSGSVGARLVDDEATYLDVMEGACAKYLQFFGFDKDDVFRAGYLLEPEESESVYTFTVDNALGYRRDPVSGMEAPVWQVTGSFGKTWPTSFQDAAPDVMKDYLSREPWWTTFTGSSAATKLANPGAIVAEVTSPNRDIQNTFQQTNFVNRYLTLFGGRRDFLTLTAKEFSTRSLGIELHDSVIVDMPRFQCSGGRVFRVISIEIDWSIPQITFGLWGGTPGDGGAIDTGGSDGASVSDPVAIQAETGIDLYTEAGEVLLVETESVFLQSEDDGPLLTEGSTLLLLE